MKCFHYLVYSYSISLWGTLEGIIFFTLKMRILRLRDVKWFTQSHTAYKNRPNSQKGLLTPDPVFFSLACGASYVSCVLFSPEKILFWRTFQTNPPGADANSVFVEPTAWKQSGQCLLSGNPGTARDHCEMASPFSTCLSTEICLFLCYGTFVL